MNGQLHHFNDADDRTDFDRSRNPGSSTDVSVWLSQFRHGITGGPWREELDPNLITFVAVGSGLFVFYAGRYVAAGHVDRHGNVTLSDCSELFQRMVSRLFAAARVAL